MLQLPQEGGFSLIEVMIAMALFAVGMLAVAGLQISSIRGNLKARETTLVAASGQAEIERLQALPFAHADLSATNGQSRSWEDGNYRYRLEVTEDELLENVKTIQLEVEYGLQGNATLTRIIAAKAGDL